MNNVLNKYFGSSLPESKMVVPRCLKLIWNHWWIISGTNFSPFQGPQAGSAAIFWPYFKILNNFPQFFWVNNSIEYWTLLNEYFWMNIRDFVLNWVLNWIIFRLNSMKKWIFKTDPISLRSAESQQYMNVVDFSEMFLYLAPSLPAVGQIGAGKYIMCCPQIIYYEDF